MFGRKKLIASFCAFTVIVVGGRASATTIGSAQLVLGLDGGTQQIVNLLIKRLVDVGTGARGAAVAAAVKTDRDNRGANTSFFGDTGLLSVSVADATGAADAQARNTLRGKVNTAHASGEIAAARSVLTWKGKVAWEAPIAAATILPDANDVLSAKVLVPYFVEATNVSVSSPAGMGDGLWNVEHTWNGQSSFQGGVSFDRDNPNSLFSGDLTAYSALFSSGPGLFSAAGLTLTDTFGFSIDYADFLSAGEVSTEFSGKMVAKAAIVPVPAAFPLLIAGLGILGFIGWRSKKLTASLSDTFDT